VTEGRAERDRPTPQGRPASPPKLLALDIDGTILDHDAAMSEPVREAVQAVAASGVHVVLATGRSLHGTLPVLDRLGLLEGWAVCSNGTVTMRLDPSLPEGYELSEVVTFDPSPALKLLREHLPTALFAVEEVGRGFRLTAPFPPGELDGEEVIVDFERLLDGPASRVIVRSPEHTSADFLALTEELGLHGVNYFVGWTAWLDLAPAGVSKASALEQVRQRLGVDRVATMAVGDGRNDLEMFSWAARSVAMGNSEPDVKAAADEVTEGVEADGVAAVLRGLLNGTRP
jgi:hydroxymethylpyrimidine pyrophosphatase-like HAD family hydrolase